MIIRWRFRRQYASSERGIFYWSRVPQGAAAITHTGTAAQTYGPFVSTASGSVKADSSAADTIGPYGSAGLGSSPLPPITSVIPAGPLSLPHDDYDDLRPWWQREKRHAVALEARLDAMRVEVGLLPPTQAKRAERAVQRAVTAIVQAPEPVRRSEPAAFDHVASYQRHFRQALQSIVSKARAEDADAAFREAVRERVAAQQAVIDAEKARIRRIMDDDERVIAMVFELL